MYQNRNNNQNRPLTPNSKLLLTYHEEGGCQIDSDELDAQINGDSES